METSDQHLNAHESLRVIRETIDLAKNDLKEDGFYFLLWGWLVAFASAADWYMAVVEGTPTHGKVWLIMVVVGIPATIFRQIRVEKPKKVQNIVRQWYGLIWLGYGISMALVIPLAVRNQLSPIPFILVLTGFATYMSGVLLKFKPLLLGAAVFWAGALWCMFLSNAHHLIIQCASAVLGYLVPGYLLKSQSQKHVSGS
jgi:hypothetical protein